MQQITVDRLIEDHRRIRAAGDALCAAVSVPTPVDPKRLEELRWDLARESLQHLGLDERHIQVPLEEHPDPEVRAKAAWFREHANAFSAAFRGHVADWPGDSAKRKWPTYARSVKELIARLHERLDLEEAELYPLAALIGVHQTGAPKRNWAGDAWTLRASIRGDPSASAGKA